MAERGTRRRAWRWLVSGLVASNVVMFLVFFGAAGSTTQALRALDSVRPCGDRAAQRLGVPFLLDPTARFVGPDTLRLRANDPDGRAVTVTCRLGDGSDTDGPLPVEAVEVTG
jgi:hypothetical protein